ncbi:hypothetical protein [Actimicrobium sp. CCI2.3]|uniref:hypothetical protein n=1 Tax=Actimicrobium sp. CCI2.3 TaxID=3048616 RepID=UPI002AB3AF38|nr:hypothetical protein [Actimicrobium sp. CCI2.3]MDY7574414.1 hypothetical protein [Actimicrobium sp. CCI2.3]MEB0022508.1 hypothetical protein [Actimicrobium sp. CCI2.3]
MDKHPATVWPFFTNTALRLADDPERDAARHWLTTTLRWLIDHGDDIVIQEVTGSAKNAGAARLLRTIVERESEVVVGHHYEGDTRLGLFAIPVLVEFPYDVPESLIDAALSSIDWKADVLPGLQAVKSSDDSLRLIARFHRLDELLAIPFSALRKAGHSLATHAAHETLVPSPFTTVDVPLRNAPTFLRFLVGQRSVTGPALMPELSMLSSRLQQALRNRFDARCSVNVLRGGGFHDALYTGMWEYQERRLEQIAHKVVQGGNGYPLTAAILTRPRHPTLTVTELRFLAGKNVLGRVGYRLHTRPVENMDRCVGRIGNVIRRAGIRNVDCATPNNDDENDNYCSAPRIILPL